jgi:hypothetical protein
MNTPTFDPLTLAPYALALVLLLLFTAVPILLGRILAQLKEMRESLDVMRHNSIKADERAER